jgi:hypothetical protein
MWGIPDDASDVDEDEAESRQDGLWGVYRFKRGFGGIREIEFFIQIFQLMYGGREPMLRELKPGEIREWGICCFQRFCDEEPRI